MVFTHCPEQLVKPVRQVQVPFGRHCWFDPQLPQLPPQLSDPHWRPLHCGAHSQLLFKQISVGVHWLPQLPQLASSEVLSTHCAPHWSPLQMH